MPERGWGGWSPHRVKTATGSTSSNEIDGAAVDLVRKCLPRRGPARRRGQRRADGADTMPPDALLPSPRPHAAPARARPGHHDAGHRDAGHRDAGNRVGADEHRRGGLRGHRPGDHGAVARRGLDHRGRHRAPGPRRRHAAQLEHAGGSRCERGRGSHLHPRARRRGSHRRPGAAGDRRPARARSRRPRRRGPQRPLRRRFPHPSAGRARPPEPWSAHPAGVHHGARPQLYHHPVTAPGDVLRIGGRADRQPPLRLGRCPRLRGPAASLHVRGPRARRRPRRLVALPGVGSRLHSLDVGRGRRAVAGGPAPAPKAATQFRATRNPSSSTAAPCAAVAITWAIRSMHSRAAVRARRPTREIDSLWTSAGSRGNQTTP